LHDLHERLSVERKRDRARRDLARWLARRPMLTRRDVLDVAAAMKAQRGNGPVQSEVSKGTNGKRRAGSLPAKGKIGKALRSARLAKDLSTSTLGDKVGLSHGSISAYEAGRAKPKPETAAKLAKVLDIPVGALSNGDARHASP
jgi:ribosome-binding protein aMBF1 (putative translation factor)